MPSRLSPIPLFKTNFSQQLSLVGRKASILEAMSLVSYPHAELWILFPLHRHATIADSLFVGFKLLEASWPHFPAVVGAPGESDFVKPSLPFGVERPPFAVLPLLTHPVAKLRILSPVHRDIAVPMRLFIAEKFVEASLPFRANPILVNHYPARRSPCKAESIELSDTVRRESAAIPLSPHRVYKAAKLWVLRIVRRYFAMTILRLERRDFSKPIIPTAPFPMLTSEGRV